MQRVYEYINLLFNVYLHNMPSLFKQLMKAVLLGRREVKDGYAAGGGWRTAKLSGREYHSVE